MFPLVLVGIRGGIATCANSLCTHPLSDRLIILWHNVHMPDEHAFTLRQVDLALADFAAIEARLDFLKAQLARTPTRWELVRIALGIMFGAAGLVIGWIEL